ncbi:MAG TPA: hypothetical protein VNK24_09420 [Elusimicrobiota bacterium]|nr:hypothetical protein [Elusimicrobiota bacterium]
MADDLELLRLVKRVRRFVKDSDEVNDDSSVAELIEALEDEALDDDE